MGENPEVDLAYEMQQDETMPIVVHPDRSVPMSQHKPQPKLDDLKKKTPSPKEQDNVKGGRARRGGDDDLKDLEVER